MVVPFPFSLNAGMGRQLTSLVRPGLIVLELNAGIPKQAAKSLYQNAPLSRGDFLPYVSFRV